MPMNDGDEASAEISDAQPSDARWLWCGFCQQPVRISRHTRGRLCLYCTGCGRSFEWWGEPPGGETNGLPPFLADCLTETEDAL